MGSEMKVELSAADVAGALGVGATALLVLGLQPILLGELLEARRGALEGVGLIAMAENRTWRRRATWRSAAAARAPAVCI